VEQRVSLIQRNGEIETPLRAVTTDNTGRFSFTGLDGGDHRLSADSDGFIHQEYGEKKVGGRGAILSSARVRDLPSI